MALTLEAALVLPLSLGLIFSVIPPSARLYHRIRTESSLLAKAQPLSVDPSSLYAIAPLIQNPQGRTSAALSPNEESGAIYQEVLMASPKLVFCLVTAAIDDCRLLGLVEP